MKICLNTLLLSILVPSVAFGLPAGGKVVGGNAKITQVNGKTLQIDQSTQKAIINWKGFSIDVNELVKINQPGSKSIVLNRVTGVDPSSILGRLIANGRVFIVNPNGVLFGPKSVVNVGGLLATTLNIKDSDFMAGKLNFTQEPGKERSYVVNQGQIKVSDNGFVFLVAPGVKNDGLILANLGKVLMGAGEKLTVDFMGDGLMTFVVEGKVLEQVKGPDGTPLNAAVSNTGSIKADGGQIVLTARASSEILSSVVNNSGVIEAHSLVNRGGVIRLEGSDPVANTGEIGWKANLAKVQNADGRVLNTGILDVSAAEAEAAQGAVTLSGAMVGNSGLILARGADGAQGGRVLVTSSDKTVITRDSVIDTSGVGNSNAGNSVIWSDKDTVFRGTILARGSDAGGNGGQIEVSGHENLAFTGEVNALAPSGAVGSLLLDPQNITVATGGAATLAQVDQFSDTPATNQTIDPTTINAAAVNISLQANNDITVTNDIALANAGVGITMQAGRDINVNANVSTNNGSIVMVANDSGATAVNRSTGSGDITMAAGTALNSGTGNIDLSVGSSTTSPFSPGAISTRTLTTGGGSISLISPNAVTLNGAINAGSGTVAIGANQDGAGTSGFVMNAGSSITTTNTTANAVHINVNAAGGGTGTAALRDISTGDGGTLTVATNTGGNPSGGDITQTAGTLLNVGSGTISLGTAAISGANIGSSGANILTTAGTITASTGTGGIFIRESDGADFMVAATGSSAVSLTSTTGALNITGASSTGSGAITLMGETVNINNTLSSTGALALNPVNAAGNLTVSSSSANNLTDGFSNITIGNSAGTGAVAVNALTVRDPLTIRAPTTTGTVTVKGPITSLGNGTVTLSGGTGATPIVLNAGITTAGNAITLSDNVGLGANVSLDTTNGGGSSGGATISITGTVNADLAANNRTLTLNSGTVGSTTLSGAVGSNQALQSLTVTNSNGLTLSGVTTASDIQLNAQNAVTLNGAINAGSGTVAIGANQDGAGTSGFVMSAGSSITTTNTTANAVHINVNAAGGGTGTAALRDISTGDGGTLTVATNTGGNPSGGDITQTAGTLLNVGSGTISLGTAAISGANIGSSGANILTTAGTITASTGTGGIFIRESDGADFMVAATGTGVINLTSSTGALNIAGATSTGSGAVTLTADEIDINAPLSSTGSLTLKPVTLNRNIGIAGGAGDLTLSSADFANLTNGFSSIIIGDANGSGVVTVGALTVGDPLTIRAPVGMGAIAVNGTITGLDNAAITLTGGTGATPITLNAGITTEGNAITLSDNVGLGTNVSLDTTNGGGSSGGATISITGTVNADLAANNRTLTLNSGTVGSATLSGAVGSNQALQSLTVTNSNGLTLSGVTTASDIQLNAQNAVTLNGAINAGSGTVTIAANQNGGGGEDFIMNAGSSITTTNATANAVQINVNAAGGGTGDAFLRDVTTGSGGTLKVATDTGGNTTGDDITQTAGTRLDVGSGTIILTTPATSASSIGTSGANILTTAGTVTAHSGTNGVFITESDGATVNASSTGAGPIDLTSTTGNLIVGTISTPSGIVNLSASAGAIQDGNGAANNITATSLSALSMTGVTLDTAINNLSSANVTGTGSIDIRNSADLVVANASAVNGDITISNNTGDLTINTLTATAGGIHLTANGGSILDGNGAALNLTASKDSTLQGLGGVVGLATDAIEVDITGATLGVAATGEVTGVSVNIDGTVLPTDTLAILNAPPGQVIFNGRVLNPTQSSPPSIDPDDLGRVTSDLNPQRVSELGCISDLLSSALHDDFVEKERPSCWLEKERSEKASVDLSEQMKRIRGEVEKQPRP